MGLLLLWKGGGISSRIALRHLSHPRLHVRSAKDHTGEETALQSVGPRAQTLKVIRTHDSPVVLTQVPILITPEEPWILIPVGGGAISRFPFGHWGNFLCAHWSPWSAFLPTYYCNGAVWTTQMLLFQSSFKLQLGLCTIFSQVSNCARVSHSFWGGIYWTRSRPLFSQLRSLLFLSH